MFPIQTGILIKVSQKAQTPTRLRENVAKVHKA